MRLELFIYRQANGPHPPPFKKLNRWFANLAVKGQHQLSQRGWMRHAPQSSSRTRLAAQLIRSIVRARCLRRWPKHPKLATVRVGVDQAAHHGIENGQQMRLRSAT